MSALELATVAYQAPTPRPELVRNGSPPEVVCHRPIAYQGFQKITDLVDERLRDGISPIVLLIDGRRGTGKTTLSRFIYQRIMDHIGVPASPQPPLFETDMCLFPRSSGVRNSPDVESYDYYNWDTMYPWLRTMLQRVRDFDQETGSVTVEANDVYLRSVHGTTHRRDGIGWTIRRRVAFPHPVLVVSGSFAHAPSITRLIDVFTPPILVLTESSLETQAQFIDQRARSKSYRSSELEVRITTHDNRGWEAFAQGNNIYSRAHIVARVEPGTVVFERNTTS